MCAIVGFVSLEIEDKQLQINRMMDRLQHRGPDDYGSWIEPEFGVVFGFRRLSILDLSPAGAQPMRSESNRYAIVFNGEIYNHLELRSELQGSGYRFRGSSDTESMLAAFEHWGFESTLKRINGMFSIALWDALEKKLYLVRDRLGVKPLYYGVLNGKLVFSSELHAIEVFENSKPQINYNSALSFLAYGYVPETHCIYENMKKVPAGTFIEFDISKNPKSQSKLIRSKEFWALKDFIPEQKVELGSGSDYRETCDQLNDLLVDSVRLRMISDVPLGAFLSGGIDSSLVVALMQSQSSQPVKTFSIGFSEKTYDEAPYARAIAEYLKSDHTELYLDPKDALDVVPKLAHIYDEPFGDVSQIPTYLVAKLARSKVTVSLSGDGGDELFLGYNRYIWGSKVWRARCFIPSILNPALLRLGQILPARLINQIFRNFSSFLPRHFRFQDPGDKLAKVSSLLSYSDPLDFYQRMIEHWDGSELEGRFSEIFSEQKLGMKFPDILSLMSFVDIKTYLPGDILTKVDRATMAVSLEGREPLLDYRLVEFAFGLPIKYKLKGAQGKQILKDVLARYLPNSLFDRAKRGFSVPLSDWLRGPLREWAENLLSVKKLNENLPVVDVARVRQTWELHIGGKGNFQNILWDILMLQAWIEARK